MANVKIPYFQADRLHLQRWTVPDGGRTRQGEPLCELLVREENGWPEAMEVTVLIPAPLSGILTHRVQAGESVNFTDPIASIRAEIW